MARLLIRRIRKAYNSGDWPVARSLAEQISENPKHSEFARDIIIRSFWNEKNWRSVISSIERWPDSDNSDYLGRAKKYLATEEKRSKPVMKKEQTKKNVYTPPTPTNTCFVDAVWQEEEIEANFYQHEQRVWLRHPNGWVYWDMPHDYRLANTHPALLCLCAETLLRPWNPVTRKPFPKTRSLGDNLALSFSGGTDSTAAMLLLPEDTILSYHERSFPSNLDHRNAKRVIEYIEQGMDREVLLVPSNHELIRSNAGEPSGFSTPYACATHLILLAEHLNLDGIAFGTPIDNGWLDQGRRFRDFTASHHWRYWSKRFNEAGLELVLPINHISEAGAMMICNQHEIMEHMNSCMRGNGLKGCEKCWKCFHKNGPIGRPFDVNSTEITTFLARRPLKTAQHAIWAVKKLGLGHVIPDLSHLLEEDLEWWEQAYRPGIDLIPSKWRDGVKQKTERYLQWMESPSPLESVDLFPDA